ncbi:glycosyltransferase family 2 protein [Salinibacter altiplanensis]|uniref:glycosyltransferase family 2 protein n=1 Tax=Salinibacter altiplanensis TaxID=1803181 RepID=UPI000C9F1CD1|nr:glycosyltransferase family 2 protein [Salinibacter altiplanensis]
MISVLILTLNEEENIGACLDSVAWSDDVLVLDSGSEDRTVDIARQHDARVMHRDFDTFAGQRNYGLEEGNLRHNWVLDLDADERVTPSLREEIETVVRNTDKTAFRVPSKLMFRDTWLKYSGMYPTYQVRLGRRDTLRFDQVGHGQRGALPRKDIGTLDEPLLHYAFSKGISDWIERHNRHLTDEARQIVENDPERIAWKDLLEGDTQSRRRALKDLSYRLPLRPLWRFFVYTTT